MFFNKKVRLGRRVVSLTHGSEQEKRALEWIEKSGIAKRVKTQMEKRLEIRRGRGPLPGPIESLRAWFLRKGFLKNVRET